MIKLKSEQDLKQLAAGGEILRKALDELTDLAVPGAVPVELDQKAREILAAADCSPAFLNYAPKGHQPFPAALCVSVNEALVHGLPSDTPLKSGDLVGLDLGLVYQGKYYLDSARTVGVGTISKEAKQLNQVVQEALAKGIAVAEPGKTTGDIGAAVQTYVEAEGYNVIKELVGHGVGFAVHEEPQVPNYGQPGSGIELEPGLVIAIEPMITQGDPTVATAPDGWTVIVASGELAAHQEHTVAITENGPQILT